MRVFAVVDVTRSTHMKVGTGRRKKKNTAPLSLGYLNIVASAGETVAY